MYSEEIFNNFWDKGINICLLNNCAISLGKSDFNSRKPILVAVHPYFEGNPEFIRNFEDLLMKYNGPVVTLETVECLEERVANYINLGKTDNIFFIPTSLGTPDPPRDSIYAHAIWQRDEFFNLFSSTRILMVGGYFGYVCEFGINLPVRMGKQVCGCLGGFSGHMAYKKKFDVRVLPKYIYGFR